MCFKHDNNVCTCAVSALILLPVVNLSLEMDSATSISYITGKVTPFNAAFRLVKVIFHCACAVYTTFLFFCRFGWKIPIHYSGPFFPRFLRSWPPKWGVISTRPPEVRPWVNRRHVTYNRQNQSNSATCGREQGTKQTRKETRQWQTSYLLRPPTLSQLGQSGCLVT